jgi:hypothetical protein
MRRALCVGVIAIAACTGQSGGPHASGPPGDVTVIASLDGSETHEVLAVDDVDGVRTITDDAAGTITFAITPPASVSLIIPDGNYNRSYVGVVPGDVLSFATQPLPPDVVHAVAAPPYAGATSYSFGDGYEMVLQADTPTAQLFTEGAGAEDVLALANDANGPIAWTAALGQTLDGTTLTLPDAWQALDTFAASYDGLPQVPIEAHVYYAEMSSPGVRPAYASVPAVANVTGPHADVAVPRAHFGGATMAVTSSFFTHDPIGNNSARVIVPTASSMHFDAGALFLPWITDVAYDASARTASWSATPGTGLEGDDVVAQLQWLTPDGVTGSWVVTAPPGATTVTIPQVPVGEPVGTIQGVIVEIDDYDGIDGFVQLSSSTHRGIPVRATMGSNLPQ